MWTDSVSISAKLIERAMFHDWPVPEDTRKKVIERMAEILDSPEARPRDCSAAARVLLSASRVSLDAVRTTIEAEDHADLCRRVVKLIKNDKLREERAAKFCQALH